MKKYLIIPALIFAACTGNDEKKTASSKQDTAGTPTAKAPIQKKEYCFLLTEGGNQDTTKIHLRIDADKVSGEMNWIPKEKDSRKGSLTGTVTGDEIDAVWRFMQEGMKDSINIAFRLSPQQLAQKPLKLNTANGRLETDASAGYTLVYKPTVCN